MPKTAGYLVVDTGGFIKNDVDSLRGMADHLVTLQEVVTEVRDRELRQRIRDTALDMEYLTPSTEAVRRVSEFARKTGDFASLSVVDVRYAAIDQMINTLCFLLLHILS